MQFVLVGLAVLTIQPSSAQYHLTARNWSPTGVTRGDYLDVIEKVCRFTARHQNDSGAIVDPVINREHQYATPYYAHALGTLLHEGRALDLRSSGQRAMEHATKCFAGGREAIPDRHGEFFIAALVGALPLYKGHVPEEQWLEWQKRLRTPRAQLVGTNFNNWETYPMKGDWMRVLAGLIDKSEAVRSIEKSWWEHQRQRIAASPWFLYHDRTSNPDTLNVEAVGRGNLLALIHLGYDGPSATEIRNIVETATRNTLMLQDPSGQTPANGRTDDHVWVDVGYGLAFEVMANRDPVLAGQYRRAASLAFRNILRWHRPDGSFSVTKNWFDHALRVGYQIASQVSNYNGSLMFHLAETVHLRTREIPEQPTPSEIGGYAFQLDDEFATAFANAGGMLVQFNLREQQWVTHGNLWTPLGVVRMSRAGHDTRLGPSDGALTKDGRVSFAPTGAVGPATWKATFVHPLLVRASMTYASGERHDFVITPDGVFANATAPVDVPVLENDGRTLVVRATDRLVTTAYDNNADQQAFLAIAGNFARGDHALRSTYGDLRPYRVSGPVFVYPRDASDPSATDVLASFRLTRNGFESMLARVEGDLYTGRFSAGGVGDRIDLDRDGQPDFTFSERCGFLIQLRDGRPVAIETDRSVEARYKGGALKLAAFNPAVVR